MQQQPRHEYEARPLLKDLAQDQLTGVAEGLSRTQLPDLDTVINVAPELYEKRLRLRAALVHVASTIEELNRNLASEGLEPVASVNTDHYEKRFAETFELPQRERTDQEKNNIFEVSEILDRLGIEENVPLVLQTHTVHRSRGSHGYLNEEYDVVRLSAIKQNGVYDITENTWRAEMWRAMYEPLSRSTHLLFDEHLTMVAPVRSHRQSEDLSSALGSGDLKVGAWWEAKRLLVALEQGLETKKRLQPMIDFLASQDLIYRLGIGEYTDFYSAYVDVELDSGTVARLVVYGDGPGKDVTPRSAALGTREGDYEKDINIWFDKNSILPRNSNLSTDLSLLDELNETLVAKQVAKT